MIRLFAVFALLLASGGCASHHRLAQCDGPLEPLNASHWQPSQAELAALQRVLPMIQQKSCPARSGCGAARRSAAGSQTGQAARTGLGNDARRAACRSCRRDFSGKGTATPSWPRRPSARMWYSRRSGTTERS